MKSGLIINPAFSHLGASPDGLIKSCDGRDKIIGLIEIKCPYNAMKFS